MRGNRGAPFGAQILIATIALPFVASAGNPDDAQTAKIFGRLYTVTFGAREYCEKAPAEAATAYKVQIDRFSREYPNLLALLQSSPYYEAARRDISDSVKARLANETPESLAADCNEFSYLLKSMIDDPAGRDAERGFEERLGAN
jgi:hypothetical protein